jgi:hypothetical protein
MTESTKTRCLSTGEGHDKISKYDIGEGHDKISKYETDVEDRLLSFILSLCYAYVLMF